MKQRPQDNPYIVLGVKPDDSDEDIKKAYRELSKIHHPDKGGDAEKMKKINAAYDILSDAEKRKYYDEPVSNPNFNPFGGNPFSNDSSGNPFDGINLDDLLNNIHGFRFETHIRSGPQGFATNVLNHTIVIPLIKALTGGDIHLEVLGKTIKFPLPKGCQSDTTFRIRIAVSEHNNTILNLLVKVDMPKLSSEQLSAIKEILDPAPVVAQEPDSVEVSGSNATAGETS